MSFYFFPTEYDQLKMEYLRKKMEQMNEIDELEKKFQYYAQFFEPKFSIRLGPDELQYIAETKVSFFNKTQSKFIQIVVGNKENFKDYQEVYNRGKTLMLDELMRLFPNEYN
jgi:hypothetical protein